MKKRKVRVKNIIGNVNKKYLKNGSYSMAITAVFIVIIFVLNMIIGELPKKYTELDISASKLYTIGEETRTLLKDLKEDVTIYQIAQDGSEDENISTLLGRYQDESDHIKVELKDPVVNPNFVLEYTKDNISMNSLIVECGEKNRVLDYSTLYESTMDYNTYSYQTTGFDGEGQITSAISYVTSEELPIIYTLEGHGEKELSSSLTESIKKANMETKTLNLLTEESVPEDAGCLMILAPSSDFSVEEKDKIIEYLENGGKAYIFSDYTGTEMENFDAILQNYGVSRADGMIFEGDNQKYAMQMPYYLLPEVKSTTGTSETASSGYYILMPYAQGIQRTAEVRDSVTIESLLTTSEKAYSKTNMNSTQMSKEDGDIDGPFDLGVRITETLENGETEIIYYSSSTLLEEQVNQMVSGGNEKLIIESLGALIGEDDSTTISIPAKSLEVSYLTLSAYDSSFWKICVIGLIPGFFLLAGFMIWMKRRKA